MKKTKGYWLFFEPYVHVALKRTSVLLYNTINGEWVKISEPNLIKLAYGTQHYMNQGVVFLPHALYEQTAVFQFINEIREKYIGDIIDTALMPEKPIQFIPIPYLRKGTVKPKSSREELTTEDIFSYFHFLTLQINNQCNLSCVDCDSAYTQNFNCFCNPKKNELEMQLAQIEKICQQVKTFPVKRIFITGGNIFTHKKFHKILGLFEDLKMRCSLGFHYLNFPEDNLLEKLQGYKLEIFVNPPYQTEKITSIIHLLIMQDIDYLFRFRLTSEIDIDLFNSSFLPLLSENNFKIEPLYNGQNFDFFDQYVSINESDIFEEPISLRNIFANCILNSNFFGQLYINCSGEVKSNPNSRNLLGNISIHSFYELISNELINSYSWKKTRRRPPCKTCLYQYLCPPISNYELAMKRNNLCHVSF